MSQKTHTDVDETVTGREQPGNLARDDLDSGIEISPRDLVDRIYRFLISKRTGLTLILAMGLLTLVGTLLEQAPDRVRDDPQAYASWLDSVRPKYGGWTNPLNMAGMFEVFSSVWFKSVTILLAVSILACTIHRTPQLWKRAMHPRIHVAEAFFSHAGLRAKVTLPLPPEQAIEQVRAALNGRRFRTITDPRGPGLNLYSDRFRYTPFGTVLAHLGFVVILGAVLISATTGFKNTQFPVTVGTRADVGYGTGLTVEARSFSDTYHADGRPKDYVSELVLYRGDRELASQEVRVNSPLRWEGVTFYQSYFGVSAVMQVKDSSGKNIFDAGVPLSFTSDDGQNAIGQFTMPDQNLMVYVVSAASGQVDPTIRAGQVRLEIFRMDSEQAIGAEVLSPGQPTTIGDLTYTFERERQFTGLIVSRDPGALWVWVGSSLMMLGLCLVLFFRHRRIWVRVRSTDEGSEVLLASTERRDSGFELWFRQFVADVGALAEKPGGHHEKVGAKDA
ncbi:cytochrome c biogenesis protein ResB [Micromonospora polyrhachis]|uniref:Cytochrome c biogenesis protein n=1 Tax=Micromonospora polyrhachis TaxID=1282883 RepID=A0A7W7SNZ7_9ACTN|nr:cytochrome c biogenesis protein ResB [Micromonospora polyrhachis]MBB4957926.1 cytochrome c biogenesis protein [Micromonospora polyrhachis]